MGDGLENHGGGMGEADQALKDCVKDLGPGHCGAPKVLTWFPCAYWATRLMARMSTVHSPWGYFDIHINSLFILFLFGHSFSILGKY